MRVSTGAVGREGEDVKRKRALGGVGMSGKRVILTSYPQRQPVHSNARKELEGKQMESLNGKEEGAEKTSVQSLLHAMTLKDFLAREMPKQDGRVNGGSIFYESRCNTATEVDGKSVRSETTDNPENTPHTPRNANDAEAPPLLPPLPSPPESKKPIGEQLPRAALRAEEEWGREVERELRDESELEQSQRFSDSSDSAGSEAYDSVCDEMSNFSAFSVYHAAGGSSVGDVSTARNTSSGGGGGGFSAGDVSSVRGTSTAANSPTRKYLATGGKDWRVHLWSNLVMDELATKEEERRKEVGFGFGSASLAGPESTAHAQSRGRTMSFDDVSTSFSMMSEAGGGTQVTTYKQRTVEDIRTVLDLIDSETAKQAIDSTLVMPVAPSDEDLVSYLDTKRPSFYIFAGAASVGVLGALWLFVLISPAVYILAIPLLFMTLNQASTFVDMGLCTRDMTIEDHMEVVETHKDYLPSVDIYLPICAEPLAVLQNTWEHVCMLDWPNLNVWVLDDGAKAQHRELADMYGFHYLTRPDRPHLKKAGNLRFAFTQTKADFFVIFDADFCPRQDFLRHTIPYFGNEPDVGIVQTPQYFKVREGQTWVEQGAGIGQELFYRLLQQNRDRSNAAICVGSCGIYRRTAVAPFGGCSYVEHSEDIRIGMLLNNIGMHTRYLPLCLSMGQCPDNLPAFFMQQYRWAQGTLTLYDDDFWNSKLTFKQRLHFLTGLFWNFSNFSSIVLLPLPSILLVCLRPDLVLWWNIAFILPALFFIQIYMRYYWISQPGKYGMCVLKVKVIECYAHLFAFRDSFMGKVVGWEPTGQVKKVDMFDKSRGLISAWVLLVSLLTFSSVAWRVAGGYPFWHFIPLTMLNAWEVAMHVNILSSQQ